jgi:hypothetical protein
MTQELVLIENLVVVSDTEQYTEVNLTADGRIQLHVEDGDSAAEPVYTVEQAEALHQALGHLLYLARQS